MSLEDEFGFEISELDAEKLKTPRDIFKYICEHEDVFEWGTDFHPFSKNLGLTWRN